jgi:diaminopimelate decarboxylase
MHHFSYRNGVLHAEDVGIREIADRIGTPFYCYSTATLERHYKVFSEAFSDVDARICYAMKANSNQSVITTLARLGAGMDVVSGGELTRALMAGVKGRDIVYSGVGKTEAEISAAIDAGVFSVNVESRSELAMISKIAQQKGAIASVSIRINPDVDARTHAKITTGKAENKFGISYADARHFYHEAASLPGVSVSGVAMHIGSQIGELEPFEIAFRLMVRLIGQLRADGHDISHVDLGGGLGIPYFEDDNLPHPRAYAEMVQRVFDGIGATLVLEPGRLITGNAGILVTSVINVKHSATKSFLIVDAAMNDLIRPTLYEANHDLIPEREGGYLDGRSYDVVGPICETGDYLAKSRYLPELAPGDLIAILTAGAYGAVQSGTYNTRPLAAEVLVRKNDFFVIRPRQMIEELIGLDRLAPWLTGQPDALNGS